MEWITTSKDKLLQAIEHRREKKKRGNMSLTMEKEEMEQIFEMTVKENAQKLKDSEAELQQRQEQMRKNLEAQRIRGN